MMTADAQASIRTHSRLANAPMRARSLVKWISGITANGKLHAEDHLAEDQ